MEVSQELFQEFNIESTALWFMLPIDDIVPEQRNKWSALAQRARCSLPLTLRIVDFVSVLPSISVFFT